MPQPQNGDAWWDHDDITVGTGEGRYDYLFFMRALVQLEIDSRALCASCGKNDEHEPPPRTYGRRCKRCNHRLTSVDACDTIADVRCWLDDGELRYEPADVAPRFAALLKGKTLAEAASVDLDAALGSQTMLDEAFRAALKDWAAKFHERRLRLPPMPEPRPYRPPRWRRVLRVIPLFRGLGL